MERYKYLIVGNSAGGIGALEAIRDVDKNGTIAIISDEPYQAYSRPLISYYLANKIPFEHIFYRNSDFYHKMGVHPIFGKSVIKIDFSRKQATLDDRETISFDKLLLATGGEPIVPENLHVDNEHVFTFTTLQDCLRIKGKIDGQNLKEAVILGGGMIGLKAAEALFERGLKVTVVELLDRILSPVLDEKASVITQEFLEEKGMRIITGHTIDKIEKGKVILDKGEIINCDLVIIAIGVRPKVSLVKDTAVKVNRGIMVDRCMATSVPDVYACGDCAEVYDFILDGFRLTPLWPTAYVGGRIAGYNMAEQKCEYTWGTGMNSIDFFGFPVISAGLIYSDEGFEVLTRFEPNERLYKKLILKDDIVMGMVMTNQIDRAGIILGLMRNRIKVTSFKDSLLSDDFGLVYFPENVRKELLGK